MTSTARQRITAWIAIFAILLAAFVPTLASSAMGGGNHLPLIEICTATGTAVQPSESGSPSPDQVMPSKHCLWCTFHSSSVLPSNGSDHFLVALEATRASRPPELPGLHGARPYLRAAPRGPPAIA